MEPRVINYLGGEKIYNKESIDQQFREKEIRIADANVVQVGESMYWPVAEDQTRVVHSDSPFEFDISGGHYSVNVPDETVLLKVAQNVPLGWHAMDGTAELNAADYPKLAAFMPQNVTNEGKIWIPYVEKHIIKITDVVA